ncbi:uncharacterized protein LAESUDRAFT_145186 [Laetiporus sulphureus 93-53]|uniref:Uncharacterized protein n=1 Tax=Laetiporus sulphureus 93-53 TaxID=1314785 RepID=A0A165EAS3_9APHY|nr:uncharacterized protein LAESUDRAFT_145186 [Laetiporus sulphureus 93-53]KZT06613.1 hypothetical protein LAESUDRAFT_145186 [Laetiporus sulphureus 93-53]
MAGNPPRLELDLSSNSTSFKRSFDQLNIDIDSSIGEDSIGGSNNASGSADSGGSERNKRARSESGSSYVDSPSFLSDSAGPSSARSLASTSSNSLTVPTDAFTAVASSSQLSPLREDSPPLGLALQNVGILPVTMEGVVSETPPPPSGSAHTTASLMSSSATQENDQFSRLSLERFNEFERNISALRHSDDPVPGPSLPLPARPPFVTDATADSPAIPDQPRSTIEGHLDNLADFAEYPESSYSFTHIVHSGHRDIASPPVLPDILPPSPFRDLDDLSWFNDGPNSNSGRESADHGAGSLSVQPSMSSTMVQEPPVSSASSHSSVPNLLGHVRALGRVRMALAPVPAPPGTEDLLTANLDSPALREETQHTYNRSRPPQIPASARSELFLPPSDTLDSTDAYGRDRISPEEALSRLEEIERSLERYLSAGLPGVEPAQGASHRLLGMQRRLSSYSGLLGTNSRIPPPTGPRGPHVVNEQNGPCETREIALIRRFIIELRVIARQMARLRATENAIRNVLESSANASATADNAARQPVTNANRSQRPDPPSTSWRPTSWRPQTSSAADLGARDLARYRYNTGPGPSTSLVSESAAERRRMLAQEAISRGLDVERSNIREIFDRLVSPTIPEHPIPSMGGYSASFATRSEQARGMSDTNDASRRGSQRGTDERRDRDQLADWYWNTPHLPSADRQREESRPGRGVPSAWREITHTDFFDDDFMLGQADRREDVGPSHVVPSTNNTGPSNTTEDGFIWDVISEYSPNTAAASGARSAEASFRTTSRPSSVTSDADYGYVHRAAASRDQPRATAADTTSVSRFEDWDGSMASYVMRRSRSTLEATSRRRQDTLARLRSMREELGEQNAPAVSFTGNARSEEDGNGYDFQDVSATIRNERAERRSSFSVNVFGSSPQQTPQQPSASRSTHSVTVQAGGAPEERASPSNARRYVVANIDAYHDGPFRAALERSNQSVRRRPGFEGDSSARGQDYGSRPPSLPPLRFQRNSIATASSVDSRPLVLQQLHTSIVQIPAHAMLVMTHGMRLSLAASQSLPNHHVQRTRQEALLGPRLGAFPTKVQARGPLFLHQPSSRVCVRVAGDQKGVRFSQNIWIAPFRLQPRAPTEPCILRHSAMKNQTTDHDRNVPHMIIGVT